MLAEGFKLRRIIRAISFAPTEHVKPNRPAPIPTDLHTTARASGKPHHYFDGQMGFRCAASAPTQ